MPNVPMPPAYSRVLKGAPLQGKVQPRAINYAANKYKKNVAKKGPK